MKYLAVLGRQAEISQAELASLFGTVSLVGDRLAGFESAEPVSIDRLGGVLKLAQPLSDSPLEFLSALPAGKITFGISDYSAKSGRTVGAEALRLKKILTRHGRSVRIVPNREPVLSTATVFHNHLGLKPNCVELLKYGRKWYVGCGVQNIDAYTRRDQGRPARDAKVGMLPPKLAQILINLCGPLPIKSRILDPFCGTGVVLQEALLMGYVPYGTDIDERMIKYSRRNLERLSPSFSLATQDATTANWDSPIDAVVSEIYLGPPLDHIPTDVELTPIKQEITSLLLKFLKNLARQIESGTPVTLAIPAWLRSDGSYERLNLLDEICALGYNRKSDVSKTDLLYHREGQVVARELMILRKK